jgi:hypothetical protein
MYSPLAQASISLPAPTMNFSNPEASYNSAYSTARDVNQQLYKNIQAGYSQMLNQSQAAMGQLDTRYRNLQRGVMKRLAGSNQANMQDIADKYSAMSGQMSQSMIDRGLGNTTVQFAMQRGIAQDRTKETTRSQNEFAQLIAANQSRLGLERLGAMERGYGNLTGIQGQNLNWMNSVSAPYPDPGMYAQLAMAGGRQHPFGGPQQLPGGPGPSPGYRPTGGYGPQSPAFYGGGGPDIQGDPYGGVPMTGYYGAAAQQQVNPYYGGGGAISGYGLSQTGVYAPSYATSGQYSTDYNAGTAQQADYSAYAPQSAATGYGPKAIYDPLY